MKVERVSLAAVTAVLALAAAGTLGLTPLGSGTAESLFELTLWTTAALFAGTAVVWFALAYVVGAGYEPPAAEVGGDDVQVRILTIDAADVVQATVDSLPDDLDDVHVVAEDAMDVAGATVHVVPDGFECDAVRKGRAIEWARRELDADREYALYLDEDSLLADWRGLPAADVVQLRERPRHTGSALSYLADVYRMGVQIEQRAFARLSVPLFAWGGGIAVRTDLEDEVTWNRETLVEDTAFVWAAAREVDVDFALAESVCRNEAPPSLAEILQQRRRWAAGNLEATALLPTRYSVLTRVRNYAWALSPVVTLVVVPLSLLGATVVYATLFVAVSALLAAFTAFWYLRGVLHYDEAEQVPLALALPLAPLVTVVHSMGTVAGILAPPEDFRVTEKAGPD